MSQDDSRLLRFVDQLGHYFEEQGASRSAGQILAWLLISEEPQSLDDLAEALQISKGSASLGTRVWEHSGFIERVSKRGDRKTYYQLRPGMSRVLAEAAMSKFQLLLNHIDAAREAIGDDRPKAKAKLDDFARVYRHLTVRVPEIFQELEDEQALEKE